MYFQENYLRFLSCEAYKESAILRCLFVNCTQALWVARPYADYSFTDTSIYQNLSLKVVNTVYHAFAYEI